MQEEFTIEMLEELQALYHVLESYNIGHPHTPQEYKEITDRIKQLEEAHKRETDRIRTRQIEKQFNTAKSLYHKGLITKLNYYQRLYDIIILYDLDLLEEITELIKQHLKNTK